MTSTFATVVLALFVPLAIGTFFVTRPLIAAMAVALGAEMFLPEMVFFKFPSLPALSKYNLPYLCIVIGCLLVCPRKLTTFPKRSRVVAVALLAIVGGLCTALTNEDTLTWGRDFFSPALTLKDGCLVGVVGIFPSWFAFCIGYALVQERDDVERVLVALGIAGLLYCPFAIVEMRMSPQFHQWIYGYTTGSFGQTIRAGGYRPKVFMTHGLTLARFFMVTTLALFVLARRRRHLWGLPVRLLAWFHLVVLVLCRSAGAIILALLGILAISFVKPKKQLLLATILAIGSITYPLLRASDLFPVSGVMNVANRLSKDRADSLAYRFINEDVLLAHARERILFGWGGGRNRLYDAEGRDLVVADGHWIIIFGIAGLVGYVVSFGMLSWPVVWARRRLRTHGSLADKTQLAGIAVIASLWLVDLIPNGLWGEHMYLVAGALMRRLIELHPTSEDSWQ